MEFECEQAEERIKWNKSFRIIFIVTFTALNFGIFAIQAQFINTPSKDHGGEPS